jgi:SsrA-binding protein
MQKDNIIAKNQKAFFNYKIEETFEAGMVLDGWEVKALREGKGQLTDGHIIIRNGELFILGCRIMPLSSASSHVDPVADRTKKLLMKKESILSLAGKIAQKGFTLVPLDLHWSSGRVKCTLGLAKGKGDYDKRTTIKEREGKREVERACKTNRV